MRKLGTSSLQIKGTQIPPPKHIQTDRHLHTQKKQQQKNKTKKQKTNKQTNKK